MKFQGIIFDLDGTLLDTIQDISDSMNDALSCMEFPVHTVQEYKNIVGNGIDNLALLAMPQDQRNEELVRRCVSLFRINYNNSWNKKTKPYNGIQNLLSKLKSKQTKMAVLSNKAHIFTDMMVKHFFGSDFFAEVRGEIQGVPKKPDPFAALDIAKKFSLNPEQIIFAGDSDTDMQTAVRAGMYPAGVLWGYRSAKELSEYGAKELLGKPDELLELLK